MKCLHLGMSQHFYGLRHGILGLWDVGIHPQNVVCLGGTAKEGLKQYTNNNLVDKNCHWWMNYYHCSHYDYYIICSLRSIGKTWFPGRFIRLQNTKWPTQIAKLQRWEAPEVARRSLHEVGASYTGHDASRKGKGVHGDQTRAEWPEQSGSQGRLNNLDLGGSVITTNK